MSESTVQPGASRWALKQAGWWTATAGAIVAGLAAVFVMLGVMLWATRPSPVVPVDPEAPSPAERLSELRAKENRELSTYGWVDREAGVLRIPLEAATDRYLAEQEPRAR